MPLMMTDVAKGQEAALQLELQPLQAQAEKERIPLETQRMQQNLESSKINQQQAQIQMQAFVEAQKDDAAAKELIGNLAKDPKFKELPIPDQMFKIAQHLDASGKFKQGAEFYSHGQTVKLQEAQSQKASSEMQQHKLDKAHNYMLMLDDTGSNVEQVMMAAQAEGALSPQEVKLLADKGREAASTGKFKQFKDFAIKNIDSIKGKAEAAKEAKDRQDLRLREDRLALEARKLEATNNRFIAALSSKEDRVVEQIALKQYTDASIKVPRLMDELRKAKKDLAALPATPKAKEILGMEFGGEDPNKDQRTILQESADSIQAEIDEAKKTRDTYAQFLPTSVKSKVDKGATLTPAATEPPKSAGTKEAPLSFPATEKELVSGKYYSTSKGVAKWDGSKFIKE